MKDFNLVNQTIAKNLIYYRKAAGMTQAEVAEKINYSDKSVSKWESGNGVPDIYILLQLASLFNVTVNDLVGNSKEKPLAENEKRKNVLRILVMLLSCGIVWLVATIIFVTSKLVAPQNDWWLCFLYAFPVTMILLVVFSGVWKYKLLNFLSVSGLIWTTIFAIYTTVKTLAVGAEEIWLLFFVGAPLQILEILWAYFRYMLVRFKETSMRFLRLKGRKSKRGISAKESDGEDDALNGKER